MANLKELRIKIGGIRAIRKVTAAMKLVAGVKLRKAEQRALASKPYANELKKILATIKRENLAKSYELFDGRESVKSEVLIAFASEDPCALMTGFEMPKIGAPPRSEGS